MKTLIITLLLLITTIGYSQTNDFGDLVVKNYLLISSTDVDNLDSSYYTFRFSADTLSIIYEDGDYDVPLNLIGRFQYLNSSVVIGRYRNEWTGEIFTFTFTPTNLVISGYDDRDFYINIYLLK